MTSELVFCIHYNIVLQSSKFAKNIATYKFCYETSIVSYLSPISLQVRYDLYDPTIQKIQVLRLEKRLDDKLFYLRDALPEYSTFSFDMDPEILPEGTPVPVNPVQVR